MFYWFLRFYAFCSNTCGRVFCFSVGFQCCFWSFIWFCLSLWVLFVLKGDLVFFSDCFLVVSIGFIVGFLRFRFVCWLRICFERWWGSCYFLGEFSLGLLGCQEIFSTERLSWRCFVYSLWLPEGQSKSGRSAFNSFCCWCLSGSSILVTSDSVLGRIQSTSSYTTRNHQTPQPYRLAQEGYYFSFFHLVGLLLCFCTKKRTRKTSIDPKRPRTLQVASLGRQRKWQVVLDRLRWRWGGAKWGAFGGRVLLKFWWFVGLFGFILRNLQSLKWFYICRFAGRLWCWLCFLVFFRLD